jgi:flagellar hook-length control protein FliK
MTITPLGPTAVADTRAPRRAGTGDDAAADGFGALIAAQLAALHGSSAEATGHLAVPAAPSGEAGTAEETDVVPGSDDTDGSETSEDSGEEAVDVAPAALVPGLTIPLKTSAPEAGGPANVSDSGEAQTSAVGTALEGGDAEADQTEQDDSTATGAARTHQGATTAEPGDTEGSENLTTDDGVSAPATSRNPLAAAATAEDATAKAGPKPEPTEPATAPVGATAATGSTAASTPAPPAGTSTSTGSAVTSQVFPTVPALVSRGEGTHSITLRLHPADLGEVHVTVTVRGGNVDVTLAAGPEAQEALRTGSGELRSLLDLAGSATGQVVVRDLPTGAPTGPTATQSSFQLPTGDAAGGGHDRGAEQDAEGNPTDRRTRGEQSGDNKQHTATPPQTTRHTTGLDLTL